MFASENLSSIILFFQFSLYFLPIIAIIGFFVYKFLKQPNVQDNDLYKEPVDLLAIEKEQRMKRNKK